MPVLGAIVWKCHVSGPKRRGVSKASGVQMTVRALQGVADKLFGIALRIMKDSFAEANHVAELIVRNLVVSRRIKCRLGIFRDMG